MCQRYPAIQDCMFYLLYILTSWIYIWKFRIQFDFSVNLAIWIVDAIWKLQCKCRGPLIMEIYTQWMWSGILLATIISLYDCIDIPRALPVLFCGLWDYYMIISWDTTCSITCILFLSLHVYMPPFLMYHKPCNFVQYTDLLIQWFSLTKFLLNTWNNGALLN